MRKQTKLVAVLSTAALLALGASMSSFAATGWQEENGTWVYYDKSGDQVTEKWEKSGDNWFYLNEDGEMATDYLVEYDDNYYYVDENGSMVTNQWVSTENEDYDGEDDDEPANYWYYFGSNGKAYKASSNSTNASFKTVNGKKYIFDDEGKMLYGWVNEDGARVTGDAAWTTSEGGLYYLGDENDGAQSIGWRMIDIVDDDYESDSEGYSSSNVFDDENQSRWFYFQSNGKKIKGKDGKSINGKKYSFDDDGRMNAEWVIFGTTPTTSTATPGQGIDGQSIASYSSSFKYFNSPEDGARVTKGWFKVVPDENLQKGKYDDDSSYWYYSDGDGDIVTSEIKTINGKKYMFDNYGRMKDGLWFVATTDGKHVTDFMADDDDTTPYDTEDNFKASAQTLIENNNYRAYYFGDGNDGSMKTGKQTVDIDGDSFNFLFNKSGSFKGAGKNGEDSSKYYLAGMLLKADKDDKYAVVKITDGKKFELLATDEFLKDAADYIDDTNIDPEKYTEYYTVDYAKAKEDKIEYKLVNTSGSVQKGKSKAKDGNDTCYSQTGENIKALYVED